MQILHSSNSQHMATEIATLLHTSITEIKIHKFASGEYICKIDHTLSENITIIGSIKTNDDLMEILSIIDATKRAGACNITLIAPYIAYGRQDVMQTPYSSLGIEIIAKILKAIGVTHLVTVDIHSADSLKLFDMKITHITAQDILAYYSGILLQNVTIIAPDAGSRDRLGTLGVKTIFLNKKRLNSKVTMTLEGNVSGKDCLIIDDIFDSGGTMITAIDILKSNGAHSITGYVTHFLGNVAPLPLYITDSISAVASTTNLIQIIALAPLIARALEQ